MTEFIESKPGESKFPRIIDEFPSPTEKEKLTSQIEEVKLLISGAGEGLPKNRARIKLADLYVGRNEPGDYQEAAKLYSEISSSSLPRDEEHAKALIGKAELALRSPDTAEIDVAIYSCGKALDLLKKDKRGFFWGKGNILLAELLLKKESEEDKRSALEIYEDIASHPEVHKYFKMRAAVGKLEVLYHFFRDLLKDKAGGAIAECESSLLPFRDKRANDYFYLKGMTVLSEVMLWKDKKQFGDKAKKMLQEVANNESAGDDLRARASLDLAEGSSPSLAKTLIKGVKQMEGLDPYLLKKAKAIEDALPPR